MKLVLAAIAIFCVIVLSNATVLTEEFIQSEWAKFKTDHKRNYPDTETETRKFATFKDNLAKIHDHNERYDRGETTYKMGINHFADLTPEEFKKSSGGLAPIPKRT